LCQKALRGGAIRSNPDILRFLNRISLDGTFRAPWGRFSSTLQEGFFNLPFEQFMGCLNDANSLTTARVIQAAYGRQHHAASNQNHQAVALIAKTLLQRRLCQQVSILTTNYDLAFEDAFRSIGCPLIRSPAPIAEQAPTFESSDHNILFAKLHGSVDDPPSMVYTFQNITRVYGTRHFSRVTDLIADSDLLLFLGYGLRDLDLRPVIKAALLGSKCTAIWNDRPAEAGDQPRSGNCEIELRGSSLARDRLRRQAAIRMHYSDLLPRDQETDPNNPLVILCQALSLPIPPIASETPFSQILAVTISDATSTLTPPEIVLFMAHLADACLTGDALPLLRPYTTGDASVSRRTEFTALYLQALINQTSYDDVTSEIARIIRSNPDVSLQFRAYVFAIATHTFNRNASGAVAMLLRALRLLLTAQRIPMKTKVLLGHYWLHFCSRLVIMTGAKIRSLPAPLPIIGRLIEGSIGTYLVLHCRALTKMVQTTADLRLLANCTDLYAQSALLVGNLRKAARLAEQTLEIYMQLQLLNDIALAERTCAWVCLGSGTPPRITEARQRLARAVALACSSPDVSLLPKFVANLIRVAAYEAKMQLSHFLCEAADDGVDLPALREMAIRLSGSQPCSFADLATFAAYLRSSQESDEDWSKMRNTLERYADVRRFPILLV